MEGGEERVRKSGFGGSRRGGKRKAARETYERAEGIGARKNESGRE